MIGGAATWVGLLLLSILIEAEVIAWLPSAQRAVLRLAAHRLDPEDRERYSEEWTAELEVLPAGPVTRLVFVLSLLIRAHKMRRPIAAPSRLRLGPVYHLVHLASVRDGKYLGDAEVGRRVVMMRMLLKSGRLWKMARKGGGGDRVAIAMVTPVLDADFIYMRGYRQPR